MREVPIPRKSMSVDSHNSLLTNREMALLSAEIDVLALTAMQTMRHSDIMAYFNAAEHYYLKACPLIPEVHRVQIEGGQYKDENGDNRRCVGLRPTVYAINDKIVGDPAYRTRNALCILLEAVKKFYFMVRLGLQSTNYYWRTSQKINSGLSAVPYFKEGEALDYGSESDGGNSEDQVSDSLK